MGTRADFYIGRGENAEWLGSIAWDGNDLATTIAKAKSQKAFREAVANFLATRDDATIPAMGWPWPWDDSNTTDYSYAFDKRKVWSSCFGNGWHSSPEKAGDSESTEKCIFPDMKSIQNVSFDGRSGVIFFGVK